MRTLIAIALMFPFMASAVNLELSVGMNQYKLISDGTWYQEAFPYDLDLRSEAWAIGISHKFEKWPLLRAEYVSLGMARTEAWAVPSDLNYNPNTHACVGECLPLAKFYSKGDVKGIALSFAPEWNVGPASVFIEGGLYIYQPTYQGSVYCCQGDVSMTGPYTVKHNSQTSYTYLFGVGVRYKNVDFSIRYYDVEAADDDVPAVYIGATTAMMRVQF